MFGLKAIALVKEVNSNLDVLPPYNNELTKDITREVISLIQSNEELVQHTEDDESRTNYLPSIRMQHAAIQRNIRCFGAYHYNRLRKIRQMRWEFGSILPTDVKSSLSSNEFKWFKDYSRILAKYMVSAVGEDGSVNLFQNLKPPKSLNLQVKCLADYGDYELSNGIIINLKKDTRYFLPQKDCEEFIRQGIFQHLV